MDICPAVHGEEWFKKKMEKLKKLKSLVHEDVLQKNIDSYVLLIRQLYKSGMLDRHLVALSPNNIFEIISENTNFYEKFH